MAQKLEILSLEESLGQERGTVERLRQVCLLYLILLQLLVLQVVALERARGRREDGPVVLEEVTAQLRD